jgi:hypothetical protein
MSRAQFAVRANVALALLFIADSLASAQATRTWVSGVGDDANPCSRTAPCKTFAGAISKTAAGGEINCIDAGGFGAITITKSITIDGDGVHAGILNAGTNGVLVNVAATDKVTIRNLSINGAGSGFNGVRMLGGGTLHVENCQIFNQAQKGISFEPTLGNSKLLVKDTIIRDNLNAATGGGIFCKPDPAGSGQVVVNGVTMDRNTFGMRIENRCSVMVTNSSASRNDQHGFFLLGNSGTTCTLNLENCVVNGNVSAALHSEGTNAIARISNISCLNNAIGLETVAGGAQILSFGNNRIAGNPVSATPTPVAQQ